MEFRNSYSEPYTIQQEAKMQHYYTYYLVSKEKRIPTLMDSVTTLQEATATYDSGLENALGADVILREKIHQDKTAVDLIVRQLQEREQMKSLHLTSIDEEMGYAKSWIWKLDHWYLGSNKGIDNTRNQFFRQIQQLEQERRTVETATWRDEAMLLKDFVEHWGAYRNDWLAYSFLNPKQDP